MTIWDSGAITFAGAVTLGSTMCQIDRQPSAGFAASVVEGVHLSQKDTTTTKALFAAVGGVGSSFSSLTRFFEQGIADIAIRRQTVALLVAYAAVTEVGSRREALEILDRIHKDARLLIGHLYGNFGRTGMPIDRPSQGQLTEFQNLVASQRLSNKLSTLVGTSY